MQLKTLIKRVHNLPLDDAEKEKLVAHLQILWGGTHNNSKTKHHLYGKLEPFKYIVKIPAWVHSILHQQAYLFIADTNQLNQYFDWIRINFFANVNDLKNAIKSKQQLKENVLK